MPRPRLFPIIRTLWLAATALLLAAGCGDDVGALVNSGDPTWARQPSGLRTTLVAVGPGLGLKSSDLYIEGEGAAPDAPILKYDGATWSAARPMVSSCLTCKVPRTASIGDLTINAATSGRVSRWDPARMAWVTEATGLRGDVLALWAADPTHVFAVGVGGGIARFDGKAWSLMDSATASTLRSVFGASSINVVAVGDGGAIVHFDGATWTSEDSGSTFGLRDVWGSSSSGFFAVGEAGVIVYHRP